jgi:hypothetical protein
MVWSGNVETGASRGRKADCDIIEDEKQSEEAKPQKCYRRPIAALRPFHLQEKRRRQQAQKADAPP